MPSLKPHWAPSLSDDVGPDSTVGLLLMLLKGFLPPVFLITLVLGSIFAGWATPTEAAGVGALGATLLAIYNRKLTWEVLKEVCHRSALTGAMLFGIFLGATAFSLRVPLARRRGADHRVHRAPGPRSWGMLFVLMGMIFFLGFFFDWIEITLIVLPVFGPLVAGLDFGDHVSAATRGLAS